jgi:hypothetical protein
MAKRIYISGAITGLHPDLVKRVFGEAEYQLIKEGYDVINPCSLNHENDHEWEDYMATDIKVLLSCHTIYMLRNWRSSRGARIEHAIAKELELEIIYEQPQSRMWWLKRMVFMKEKEVKHAA